MTTRYVIHRFRLSGPTRTVKTVDTLEEAQEHCRREDTRGGSTEDGTAWFDGYESYEVDDA